MAVDWNRLWSKRIRPGLSPPALPLPDTETIISKIHEEIISEILKTHREIDDILISCVNENFRDRDNEFRRFAFMDIGEDMVVISKVAAQFTCHVRGGWTAQELYEMWKDLMESDHKYIESSAAKYGCFLDIFVAFPAFEIVRSSEREQYICEVAQFLTESYKIRRGLGRQSVQQWLVHSGNSAIEWCLDRLSCLDMNKEWDFTLSMTRLVFHGLQAEDKRCQIAKVSRDQRITLQQTHILKILEQVHLSAKLKYLDPRDKTLQCIADCLEFSRSNWIAVGEPQDWSMRDPDEHIGKYNL